MGLLPRHNRTHLSATAALPDWGLRGNREQFAYCLCEDQRSPLAKVKPVGREFSYPFKSLSEKRRAKKNFSELTALRDKLVVCISPYKSHALLRAVYILTHMPP